jgi:hypothetical protein
MACSDDGAPTAMTGTVRVAISDEQVELIKSPHPGLLVISSGLFVLAAGGIFFKRGGRGRHSAGSSRIISADSLCHISESIGFTLILDSRAAVTVMGSVTEATALVAVVELAPAISMAQERLWEPNLFAIHLLREIALHFVGTTVDECSPQNLHHTRNTTKCRTEFWKSFILTCYLVLLCSHFCAALRFLLL